MLRMLAFHFWMKARVTVLGSGTSHGVPMIGCTCAVCRRPIRAIAARRPSIYRRRSRTARRSWSTPPPTCAQQALSHGVTRVDAILFTHSHADHIMGMDEVRRFNAMQGGRDPGYADERTAARSAPHVHYVFDPPNEKGGGIPQIALHDDRRAVQRRRRRRPAGAALARLAADSRLSLRHVRLSDRLQPPRRRGVAAARRRRRR